MQLLRYIIVGIISNATGYCTYLFITWYGVEPKLAMTAIYMLAASLGYIGHRQWSFSHKGNIASSALRYGLVHLSGYLLNYTMLAFFVDKHNYPHEIVQAVAIIVVAGYLFILFRYFVFPENYKQTVS